MTTTVTINQDDKDKDNNKEDCNLGNNRIINATTIKEGKETKDNDNDYSSLYFIRCP